MIELNGKTQARKHHFKEARQLAKPVNFGVPGGSGCRQPGGLRPAHLQG